MPIDPTIALNANRPAPANPLQQALSVAQFRYMNSNGQAMQQQLAANRATSAAYQEATDPTTGQVDNNKLVGILSQNPDAAYNLPQVIQGINTQKQQQIGIDTSSFDLAKKKMDWGNSTAGMIASNPNATQADVIDIMRQGLQSGMIDPQHVGMVLASLPPANAPAGAVQKWALAHVQNAAGPQAQVAGMTPQYAQINTGPATVAVNQNPLAVGGGVGTVGYTLKNGLTAADAAAQIPVINADGSQGTRSKASVLQQQGLGGLLPPDAQGAAGGDGRYPGNGGVVQTSPAAGVAEATAKANAAGGDQWVADQASNANSNTRVNMLGNALTALQNSTTGNGADKLQAVKSLLVTLGAAPQSTVDSVQNFDEANKYLTQYAQQKAAGFGHGTDAQLAASISGNGNTHISNLAAQDVVKVNLALERMEQARTAAFQQQMDAGAVKPSDYSSWKSKFGSTMDPRVFIADQVPIAKTQAMVKSMTPQQQATFKAQYNWAVQNGYINGPQ